MDTVYEFKISETVIARFSNRIADGRVVRNLKYVENSILPFQGIVSGVPVCWYATGQFFNGRKSSLDLRRIVEVV